MKDFIKRRLHKLGYELRNLKAYKTNYKIVEKGLLVNVDEGIVDEIFEFFETWAPFYSSDIRSELQINGALRADFLERRKTQLDLIANKNRSAYAKLLDSMLKNELMSGLPSGFDFNENLIGADTPMEADYMLSCFKNMTGMSPSVLTDGDFGDLWGLDTGEEIIELYSPYYGVNTFNISNLISYFSKSNGCYIDLGSGLGNDAIKVEKMSSMPIRSILIDLPLNLTTAYAYVAMNTGKKCTLVKTKDDFGLLNEQDFDESHFVFVPTSLIEEFCRLNIDVDVLYNHGSFSEMDYDTIEFYLTQLLNGKVKSLFEINSNSSIENTGGHIEIPSSRFPIPKNYKLVKRNPSLQRFFGHRYLESLYIKN